MARPILATLLALALVAGAGLAAADEGKKANAKNGSENDHQGEGRHAEWRKVDGGGQFLLRNDKIAVWFESSHDLAKPDLRVTFNGTNDTKSGYRVQILRILEVGPDASHGFARGLPQMNLAKKDDWNVQTEQVNDTVTLTMIRAEAQGVVALVFHIDGAAATVKYDVSIHNWRWANPNDRLALDMLVLGHNLRNETGAKISVGDAGYVSWADSATVKDANGTRTIPVEAINKNLREARDDHEDDDNEEARSAASGGHIYLLFNGTGGYSSLVYDPTFGIASSGATTTSPVPFVAPLVAVAALGAVAVALGRRGK